MTLHSWHLALCGRLLPFHTRKNVQTTDGVSVLSSDDSVSFLLKENCAEKESLEKSNLGLLPPSICLGKKVSHSVFFSFLPEGLSALLASLGKLLGLPCRAGQRLTGPQIKIRVLSKCSPFLGIVDSYRPHGLISVILKREMIRANGSKWR